MYKEVFIKAIIPTAPGVDTYSIYLLSRSENIVFPIKVYLRSAEELALALQNNPSPRPHLHDTLRRIVNALKAHIKATLIDTEKNGIYYTYIQLEINGQVLEIDAKLTDALAIAIRCNAPIYVSSKLLLKHGIKITEELLNYPQETH